MKLKKKKKRERENKDMLLGLGFSLCKFSLSAIGEVSKQDAIISCNLL